MRFQTITQDQHDALVDLFRRSFADSAGEQEGEQIAQLVSALSHALDGAEVTGFASVEGGALIGAIFFTRLRFDDDALVHMLAPVAVATAHQRTGVGQALIRHGLQAMARQGASVAITYGDPAYYGQLGFEPLSESVIQAPMPMSMPEGWLGQSLIDQPIQARRERPRCVAPFQDPAHW
jgi:predicted N-acetyltransferase YhbS